MTTQVNSDNDKAKITYFGLDVDTPNNSTKEFSVTQDKRVQVDYNRIKFDDNLTSRSLPVKEHKYHREQYYEHDNKLNIKFEGWGDRQPFQSDIVHSYASKFQQVLQDLMKTTPVRTKIDPNVDNVPNTHIQKL
jgi:hypothetical protein